MSESISPNLGQRTSAPLDAGTIGCVCQTDEVVAAAAAALMKKGIAADAIHIGATEAERATAVAQRNGVCGDVLAGDPLQGFAELGDEAAARRAIDRAGVIGAAAGALVGIAIGITPAGTIVPVPHQLQTLASCLLFFVLGTIVGSVLGAAFAPQPSSHAGFRLIDGMQDGGFALIVVVPRARLDEVQRILETAGGTGITRL